MRLAKKIVYNATATVVNVLSGFLRNKIVASYLSLTLFGILSIGQQSASLLFTFFAFGLPLGITTVAAQLLTRSDQEQRVDISRLIVLALSIALLCFVCVLAAVLADPFFVSRAVTSKESYATPVAIVLFAAPFMVVENCLFAILEGTGRLREIVVFKTVPALVSVPLFFVLTAAYGLNGAAVGVLSNELLLSLVGFILLRKSIALAPEIFRLLSVFRRVIKVAMLSFLVGAGWFLVDFVIKRHVLQTLGETENGIIQSVAKITDLYPNIALSWLSMHLFPSIATKGDDKSGIANVVERTTLAAVAVVVPVVVALFAFRPLVLEVVYKREFTVAVSYFGAMLTNGVPKVFSWVLGLALLPMGLKKEWFWSTMVFIVLYAAIAWFGLQSGWSIYSLPAAGGVALCVQTAYILVAYRKHGVRFQRTFLVQLAGVLAVAGLVVLAVFWQPALVLVLVPYTFLLSRFGIINDLKNIAHEFRGNDTR